MSEYYFGTGKGRVSRKAERAIDKIAAAHKATFTNVSLPGDGAKFWFACRSYGAPFDGQTERAVMKDCESIFAAERAAGRIQ